MTTFTRYVHKKEGFARNILWASLPCLVCEKRIYVIKLHAGYAPDNSLVRFLGNQVGVLRDPPSDVLGSGHCGFPARFARGIDFLDVQEADPHLFVSPRYTCTPVPA
jgi:hypothetical protein